MTHRIKRYFGAILAAAILCTTLAAATLVPAGDVQSPPAGVGICNIFTNYTNQQAGENTWSDEAYGDPAISGVKANLNLGNSFNDFRTCDNGSAHADDNATSAWIALVPEDYSGTTIVQFGIANCHDASGQPGVTGPCEDGRQHTDRWFMAGGGCNGQTPIGEDLGAADRNAHNIQIHLSGSNVLFTLDGDVILTAPKSHAAWNCWIDDPKLATFHTERWDTGDTFGVAGGDLSHDTNLAGAYVLDSGTGLWRNPQFAGPCDVIEDGEINCTVNNSNTLTISDD